MTGSSSGTGADLGQTASRQDFMLWWERQLAWVWYLLIIASCMDNTDVWGHTNCLRGVCVCVRCYAGNSGHNRYDGVKRGQLPQRASPVICQVVDKGEACSLQSPIPIPCNPPKSTRRKEKIKVRLQVSKKECFLLGFFSSPFHIMKSTLAGVKLLPCLDCALPQCREQTSQLWPNFKLHRGKISGSYFDHVPHSGQRGCLLILILTIGQYLLMFNQ